MVKLYMLLLTIYVKQFGFQSMSKCAKQFSIVYTNITLHLH